MLANDNMWNLKKKPIDVEYKFWLLKFGIYKVGLLDPNSIDV
jgi:hypothetical protein